MGHRREPTSASPPVRRADPAQGPGLDCTPAGVLRLVEALGARLRELRAAIDRRHPAEVTRAADEPGPAQEPAQEPAPEHLTGGGSSAALLPDAGTGFEDDGRAQLLELIDAVTDDGRGLWRILHTSTGLEQTVLDKARSLAADVGEVCRQSRPVLAELVDAHDRADPDALVDGAFEAAGALVGHATACLHGTCALASGKPTRCTPGPARVRLRYLYREGRTDCWADGPPGCIEHAAQDLALWGTGHRVEVLGDDDATFQVQALAGQIRGRTGTAADAPA